MLDGYFPEQGSDTKIQFEGHKKGGSIVLVIDECGYDGWGEVGGQLIGVEYRPLLDCAQYKCSERGGN